MLLAACAPAMPALDAGQATRYEPLDVIPLGEDGFERGAGAHLALALPPELARGPHHAVELVEVDGFTNRYTVASQFGALEVESIGLLRKRVHEIKVLAALEQHGVSSERVYFLAVANAAEGPLEGAAQLLFHPVRSATDVPSGMWSYAKRLVEMTERDRTYQEDDYGQELVGFSDAKREWAYRLGVDVYSGNSLLQKQLDRYAWLSLSGGLTVRLPLMVVSGPAGIALTVTSTATQMKRELRDRAPEEIRIDTRKKLLAMGVEETLAERFVGHPWYSPTRQLVIAASLDALPGAANRAAFIEAAVLADEPDETWFFTRMALMLSVYSDLESPIAELVSPRGLVMARDVDGGLVVPLYLDLGLWTQPMQRFVDAMEVALPESPAQKTLLASGSFSRRARSELAARGWTIREGVEMTWLAEVDAEAFAPGQPDPDRILPEIRQ
jgi:hypothetical protein